jgi:hypothetical protein
MSFNVYRQARPQRWSREPEVSLSRLELSLAFFEEAATCNGTSFRQRVTAKRGEDFSVVPRLTSENVSAPRS